VRKAINENPVVQFGLIGVLVVIFGFLFLTRVMHHKSSSTTPTSTTPTTATPAGGTATPTAPSTAAPGAVAPSTGTTPSPSATIPGGKLVAGPGLPKAVASAYAHNEAIVVLITRRRGVDDDAVKASVERLRTNPLLAVFVANAGKISRFSRVTEGVNVNRVPALVVVRPKNLTSGPPTASVSYGFRSPASVVQAVRNAVYTGPTNLPYYPK
jgi:hypothetical protein